MVTAEELIALLQLRPHPKEGGFFRETYRSADRYAAGHLPPRYRGDRCAGTAIYYLLKEGSVSAKHRVDADEVWHFYAGDPLELVIGDEHVTLGTNFAAGERPQILVPAHEWQSARTLGEWTLAGCTVSPAFEFEGFEMASEETSANGTSR